MINPQITRGRLGRPEADSPAEHDSGGCLGCDLGQLPWPCVGNTLADLFTVLRNDQAQLAKSGVSTDSISRLTNFEIQKADDISPLADIPVPSIRHAGAGSTADLRAELWTIGRRAVPSRPAGSGAGSITSISLLLSIA